jgi:uncharacterized protein YjiS (DUF1127 family)
MTREQNQEKSYDKLRHSLRRPDHERAGNVYWAMRRDLVLRKGLSRLDRRLLRDIGIDRNAA